MAGTNLNPGADQTLVAAAYRASMANVPKDLSGTFEALAKSYDETMKSVAESWSSVIEKVAPLAANMVNNAIKKDSLETQYGSHLFNRPASFGDKGVLSKDEWAEQNKNIDTTTGMTYDKYLKELPQTQISVSELLTNIRDEKKSLFGKNDPASKKRRLELKGEKEQVYNELEFLGKVDQVNVDILKSGNFDPTATGQPNVVLAAAIQEFGTKSGKILEGDYKGYYVDLGDNANGEFTFTLKTPKNIDGSGGETVTGENTDGTLQTGGSIPVSVPSSKVGDILIPKYSKENLDGVNKVLDGLLKQSKTQYSSINVGNKIAAFVDNEKDLLGLMQKALGSHPTSFIDELNSESETSAAYFASLGSVKLEKLGVTDADGDGTIGDAGDFTAGNAQSTENYKIVKSKVLERTNDDYRFKDTQTAFLAYVDTVGRKMHNFQPTVINNNNNNTTNPYKGGLSGEALGYPGKGWQSETVLLKRSQAVDNKSTVHGLAGDYLWNGSVYKLDDQTYTPYKVKENEGLLLPGIDKDPSVYENQRKAQFEKHSAVDLTNMATFEGADDKQVMSIFNDKYKDSKFKLDATFRDNEEAIYITHNNGNKQKILLSATTAQDIADYMNEYDPKYVVGKVYPKGKGKNKKYGKFVSVEEGFEETDKDGNPV